MKLRNSFISSLVLTATAVAMGSSVSAQGVYNTSTVGYLPPPIVGKRTIYDKDVTASFKNYYGQAVPGQATSTQVLTTSAPKVTTETITIPAAQVEGGASSSSSSVASATQLNVGANTQGYLVPQIQQQYQVQQAAPRYVQQYQIQQPQYVQYIQQPQLIQQPVQYVQQQQYVQAPAPKQVQTGTQYYVSYGEKIVPTVETRTVQVTVNKTVRVPQYYKANVYTNVHHGPVMRVGTLPEGIQVPANAQAAFGAFSTAQPTQVLETANTSNFN